MADNYSTLLSDFHYHLCILGERGSPRNPRFLRNGIQSVLRQIKKGESRIIRAYTKQLLSNWRGNYEFILRSYFPTSMGSSDSR